MAFWDLANVEPKRSFRYKIIFGGNGDTVDLANTTWFAQKVTKPSFKVSAVEYQYLNHKFKYPGRVEWEDISIDFVDPGGSNGMNDMAKLLTKVIHAAGYSVPSSGADLTSISKSTMTKLVGGEDNYFQIIQLDAAGNDIENWKVYNPMFLDMKFSDLSYDTDEMSKITVTVKYDYATLNQTADIWAFEKGFLSKAY